MGTAAGTPEARELTPEEKAAEAKLCFGLHQNVVAALEEGRAALWKLAEHLSEFDSHVGWAQLGYETKSEWLADPEVGLSHRTYNRLVRAWRILHDRYQLDRPTLASLEMSKVDIVLPAVEKGSKSLKDAIDDVQSLGARDLRETYWGEKDGQAASPPPQEAPQDQPGPEPVVVDTNGSAPVRASDGTPVDELLGAEVDPDHELDEEDETPDLDLKQFVRCTHCGGMVDIHEAEKAEAPPVIE